MKLGAIYSSETSLSTYMSTKLYNQEDLHRHTIDVLSNYKYTQHSFAYEHDNDVAKKVQLVIQN
jgi:hypothetical protein